MIFVKTPQKMLNKALSNNLDKAYLTWIISPRAKDEYSILGECFLGINYQEMFNCAPNLMYIGLRYHKIYGYLENEMPVEKSLFLDYIIKYK